MRIENYAIIGDGETAALVSAGGSIDWLCWPRFDSPACFAALLGTARHGRWLIAPVGEATSRRAYRGDTLILETTFDTPTGRAVVLDFMPRRGTRSDVIRVVRGKTGNVKFRSDLLVRFGYGSIIPWLSEARDVTTELHAVAGPTSSHCAHPSSCAAMTIVPWATFRLPRMKKFHSCSRIHRPTWRRRGRSM